MVQALCPSAWIAAEPANVPIPRRRQNRTCLASPTVVQPTVLIRQLLGTPSSWPHAVKILVTAGNTQTPIDQVRCITNIFTGKTGARIAVGAAARGHDVRLLTSHPQTADAIRAESAVPERPKVEA